MKIQDRAVLMILDNAPSHNRLVNCSKIILLFISPNISALVQPLDQGIIKVTKDRYKKRLNNI